jgi:hypothetical protein
MPSSPPNFQQFYEHRDGRGQASREDVMMALADLDLFLIRATHTDDQTSTRWEGRGIWHKGGDGDFGNGLAGILGQNALLRTPAAFSAIIFHE